ncbi:uncharacterized protein LOC125378971 [Haliotis rufescens]|uniref:uncharacterized protein LOC125378971 n=1 Tax=Haliotis rufescens TaxID=6454 RepID=UPI00201F51F2|nr:uncharacterized protein LOC125378971 [Haliotis rufescens]
MCQLHVEERTEFITDSVCTVETVSVAFVDLCHTDDWFIEYIEVNYEEMETGEGIVILFNTYYWFTAHGDEDQTTGITCDSAASYDDGEDDGTAGTRVNSLQYKQTCMTICDSCDGGEDDGTAGTSVGSLGYKHTCKKRCEKQKAKYSVYIKTGRERNAGSKADLVLTLEGWCGQVSKELTNGIDIRLRKGRAGTLKFIADSVCGMKTIGVAFSDPCHKDDWLIEYITVVTVEMATRNRDRKTFRTNYWLSAHGDDDEDDDEHTTGIKCVNVQLQGFTSIIKKQYATCRSYQVCG